jgi:hypothetical protein
MSVGLLGGLVVLMAIGVVVAIIVAIVVAVQSGRRPAPPQEHPERPVRRDPALMALMVAGAVAVLALALYVVPLPGPLGGLAGSIVRVPLFLIAMWPVWLLVAAVAVVVALFRRLDAIERRLDAIDRDRLTL